MGAELAMVSKKRPSLTLAPARAAQPERAFEVPSRVDGAPATAHGFGRITVTPEAPSSAGLGLANAPPIVYEVLQSPGQPLDAAIRTSMESRFGHDFSRVRVHTGAKAAQSARAVNARAYTVASDVVLREGQTRDDGLLAHELAHVVQGRQVIARADETIPGPSFEELMGPSLERARRYTVRLPPPKPIDIPIPPPPLPEEPAAPATCPSEEEIRGKLRSGDVAANTRRAMEKVVAAGATGGRGERGRATPAMVQQADQAVRAEFGRLLPPGRRFAAPGAVTIRPPAAFAAFRVPNDAVAAERIAVAALKANREVLAALCITDSADTALRSEIAGPLLRSMGIEFVRRYEQETIGGQTRSGQPGERPRVDLPREHKHMGHPIVHEAMHFYVHDRYRAAADASPLWSELMDGGAEFLARHVIGQRLAQRPEFQIVEDVYRQQWAYVRDHLLRGGVEHFAVAYFQGHPDLLGLPAAPATPTPVAPMSAAAFAAAMKERYGTTAVRTGTREEQTRMMAMEARRPASAVVLPEWERWDPGARSRTYNRILEGPTGFRRTFGDVPTIREVVFFATAYDVRVSSAGVATVNAEPGALAQFVGGVLTVYRAAASSDYALPVSRSRPDGNYPERPPGALTVSVPGGSPGAPLLEPSREESIRRMMSHELAHGLFTMGERLEPGMRDAYMRASGWTLKLPPGHRGVGPLLFDVGQKDVEAALSENTPPPRGSQNITVGDWNSPRWREQPLSVYMVVSPGEDFAEAVMAFVQAPRLLLARSSHRYHFLQTRRERWYQALLGGQGTTR